MTAIAHRAAAPAKAAPTKTAPKRAEARMECRMTQDIQELLKTAADMSGRSLTDFVVSAATTAAHQVIEQAHVVRLSLTDQRRFADAILAPAEPTDALVRAFKRRRERMGDT
jgi:uncharacterized protein (DUF1778 family)